MQKKLSTRRLVENQVAFRTINEKVLSGIENLEKIAKEDNQEDLLISSDKPLHFYCECSDENCRERVTLKRSVYSEIHENRKQFVIVSGHEAKSIEKIVDNNKAFSTVEKLYDPPEMAHKLNATSFSAT